MVEESCRIQLSYIMNLMEEEVNRTGYREMSMTTRIRAAVQASRLTLVNRLQDSFYGASAQLPSTRPDQHGICDTYSEYSVLSFYSVQGETCNFWLLQSVRQKNSYRKTLCLFRLYTLFCIKKKAIATVIDRIVLCSAYPPYFLQSATSTQSTASAPTLGHYRSSIHYMYSCFPNQVCFT